MKKRYIILLLFVAFEIFTDFYVETRHNFSFVPSSEAPSIIELHNYGISRNAYGRKYLIRTRSDISPYWLVVHIVIDDPNKVIKISAKRGNEWVFNAFGDDIDPSEDNIVAEDMVSYISISYSECPYHGHDNGYYTLHFSQLEIEDDNPLSIKITYTNELGDEIVDEIKAVRSESRDWGFFSKGILMQ